MFMPYPIAEIGRLAVPAQERLKQDDQIVAFIIGLGITIVIVSFILMAIGSVGTGDGSAGLAFGFLLIGLGVGFWLFQVQPWKGFDDLTTPHFTGHAHDDEHHAEPAAAAVAAEPAVVAEAPKPEPEPEPKAEPAPKPAAKAPEPEPEPEPEPAAEPDDLTLIEGIGPKSAEALAAAGITTYAQVAATSPADLEKAIKDRKVRLVGSAETWPEQARIAAGGDLTALEQYQGRIKQVTDEAPEDDLTLIEGIGPKSGEALKNAGIKTFAQVAATSPADLEKAIKDQKVRLVGSTETWPMQADLAAKGDLDGLKALQARIKGGVLQDE